MLILSIIPQQKKTICFLPANLYEFPFCITWSKIVLSNICACKLSISNELENILYPEIL